MTKKDLNYHKQEKTCVFCTKFDIKDDGGVMFVCSEMDGLVDEGGICDAYELDDKPF